MGLALSYEGEALQHFHTKEKVIIMKKLIQIFSLLSLLVVFTAAGASAQTSYGTDVEIPFAFNVGDKSYDAGHYIVKVSSQAVGATLLSIQDTKTDEVQRTFLNVSGDAPSSELKLMFATIGDRKYLNKVQTPSHGYSVLRSKAEKEARRAKSDTAAASISGGANLF